MTNRSLFSETDPKKWSNDVRHVIFKLPPSETLFRPNYKETKNIELFVYLFINFVEHTTSFTQRRAYQKYYTARAVDCD